MNWVGFQNIDRQHEFRNINPRLLLLMKRLLILSLVCVLASSMNGAEPAKKAEGKPAGKLKKEKKLKTQEAAKDKAKGEKKEEEKPSPPPSGPQSDGHFRKVILDSDQKVGDKYEDTLVDPMELTLAPDGRFFFVERAGVVKMWTPETQKSVEIGRLKVHTGQEDGLLGITLDPKFSENSWIYLNYSLPETRTNAAGKKFGTNRVARFTVSGSKLDLSSEKPLLHIPTQREQCCHAGGSLAFDRHGNLFIATGDNTNPFDSDGFAPIDERPDRSPWDAQKSSANANDLRGKVLRIHPEPNGTYTIPEGNLFPVAANSKSGHQARGAELLTLHDPAPATRPEIYVMGCRNPFRLSIDQQADTLYFGDVGPDAKEFKESRGPAGFDEINQARAAGNFGWPYFIAENKPYWNRDFTAPSNDVVKIKFDPANPLNDSANNTGIRKLPAAQPAMIWYPNSASTRFPAVNGDGGRSALAGPVYRYNEDLKSSRKLPKEYDGTLFIYDWSRNWIIAVKLTPNGQIKLMERFCPGMTFKRPIDLELGPDGCLYVIEWGTAWGKNKDNQIARIEYAAD